MRPGDRLNELTAGDIVRITSSGDATAEAVVRTCLDRIDEREQAVNAWTHLDADHAIAQARVIDAGGTRGALHGVPVAVKDIIATADMPTGYGSPIYAGHRPAWDAACVAAIRAAGGIILGKTVTTEFASSHPGKTAHPQDPARTPGGSSSGSAAAVADYMSPLAIGTQTGGSVIRPASFCGIVGYKPSFGWVNRHGVKPLSESLDTVGAMGRTVADAARLVSVLAGRPALLDLPGAARPRIALWRSDTLGKAEDDMLACLEDAASRFSTHGAYVADVTPPAIFSDLDAAHHEIEFYEMGKSLAFELIAHPGQISAALRSRLEAGQACPPELYDEKHRIAAEGRFALRPVFADFDVILTPGALGEAPLGHGSTGNALFNRVWTLLYGPAVTVCAGRGRHGMPLGLQFIGLLNDDRRVLAVAQWAETVLTR